VSGAPLHLAKPRLRGWLHQVAFFVSIPAGITLVAVAAPTRARVGAAVFAVSLTALYGVSAAYHRVHWSEQAHRVMKHLDHSMIFVFIAGSYTPLTLVALQPAWGITLLALTWTGAAAGIAVTALRLEHWRSVGFALYLTLGWLAVVALPELLRALSTLELVLLVTGGVLYTIGAIVLARNRPDPHPAVFGYHEIWHTLVTAASTCHFTLILSLVRT
jgi:hemolysin III